MAYDRKVKKRAERASCQRLCVLFCLSAALCATLILAVGSAFAAPADGQLKESLRERFLAAKKSGLTVTVRNDMPPLSYVDRTGEPVGLLVDIWKLWSQRNGVPVLLRAQGKKAGYRDVLVGVSDVLGGVVARDIVEHRIALAGPVYGRQWSVFYRSDRLNPGGLEDFVGTRLAVVDRSPAAEKLLSQAPYIELVPFVSVRQAVKGAMQKNMDGVLVPTLEARQLTFEGGLQGQLLKLPGWDFIEDVRPGFPEDKELYRALLNAGFEAVFPEDYLRIEKRWISSPEDFLYQSGEGKLLLSQWEREWMHHHPAITLGMPYSFPPYSFQDKEGNLQGLLVDTLRRVAHHAGLGLRLVPVPPVNGPIEMIERGVIDGYGGIVGASEGQLLQTRAMTSMPAVLFTRSTEDYSSLDDLDGKRVGLYRDGQYAKLDKRYPDVTFVYVNSLGELWPRLLTGDLDACISTLPTASFYAEQQGIAQLRVGQLFDTPVQFSVGIRRDWPELRSILQKSYESLPIAEKKDINRAWFGIKMQAGLRKDQVWRVGMQLTAAALFVFISFILWNRKLAKEVARRKDAEFKASSVQNFLRNVLDGLPVPMFLKNEEGRFKFVNRPFCLFFGLGPEHVLDRDESEVFPDEFIHSSREVEQDLLIGAGHRTVTQEVQLSTAGQKADVLVARKLIVSKDDEWARGIAGAFFDISVRKKHEREMQHEAERLMRVAEASGDGFWDWNIGETAMYLSPTLYGMLGYAKGELAASADTWQRIIHPEDRDSVMEAFRKHIDSMTPLHREFRLIHKNGTEIWVMARALFLNDKDKGHGITTRVVCVYTDITMRKTLEEDLRKSRDEALSSSEAKTRFLARLGNEIRTPMNGVIGMSELLRDTELNERQLEYVHAIRSAGESMLTVVSDITDFSRLESGRMDIDSIVFNLRDRVFETLKNLSGFADEKDLGFVLSVEPQVPEYVFGDPRRLGRVLDILASNAIRHTEAGQVSVQVSFKKFSGKHVQLEFTVSDTGEGIPHEEQRRIFETFVKSDGIVTRSGNASGLGLAIVAKLVRLMGGEVSVNTSPQEGSLFSFTIMMEVPTDVTVDDEVFVDSRWLEGQSVLLVAPLLEERRELAQKLEDWGMNVFAVDGIEAAQVSLEDAPHTSLLILDKDTMGEEGIAFLRKVRHTPGLVSLVMTARTEHADKFWGHESGIAGTIQKPFEETNLLRSLSRAVGSWENVPLSRSALYGVSHAGSRGTLQVLLVEDTRINMNIAQELLNSFGHNVVAVMDGMEALQVLTEREFDLVILDVQLSRMSGLELVERLREREKETGKYTPVIGMLMEPTEEAKQAVLDAGMDGYLSKPVTPGALYVSLERVQGAHKAEFESLARNFDQMQAKERIADPAQDSVLDFRRIREVFGNQREFMRDNASLFVEDAPLRMEELNSAVDDADALALEMKAQTLRGAVGYFASGRAYDLLLALEQSARRENFTLARQQVRELDQYLDMMIAELRKL